MKLKWSYVLSVLLALCIVALAVAADIPERQTEEKVIQLQAGHSYMMTGDDSKPIHVKPNEVLPYLLEKGWRVKSLHTAPGGSSLSGYAVLERPKLK